MGSIYVVAVDLSLLQTRMHVEQVGHKRQVEFAVSRCNVVRGNKLSAVQPGGLLQHQLSPSVQIALLYRNIKQKHWNTAVIDTCGILPEVVKQRNNKIILTLIY